MASFNPPPLPKGFTPTPTDDNIPALPKGFTPDSQKKSPVGNASPNGSNSLLGGQNFSQSSPLTGTENPIIKQARTQADKQINAEVKAHQAQSDYYTKALQAYDEHLTPQERQTYQQMLATPREPDNLREPSQAELAHRNFMDSPLGKVAQIPMYLGSKATKGSVQLLKGGAWLADMGAHPTKFVTGGETLDEKLNPIDKYTDLGLSKTDVANIESKKGLGYGALRTGGMLAEFAPAIAAGEVSKAPKVAFLLQGFGQGKETMDAVDPQQKLNPTVRNAFILGTGAVNGLLMGDLGENVFGKMPASVRGKVVSAIAADALKETAGKELTSAAYKEALQNGAKDFADKFQKFGTNYLTKVAKTGIDLSALNTANFALKEGVNAASGEKVFNQTPGDLAEQITDVTLKQAPLFGALGSIGDATKLTPYSNFKNEIVEHITNNPDDAQAVKDNIVNHGVQNGWTPDEIKATNDHITQIADAAKKIPPQIPEGKRSDAVQLVLDKGKLEGALKDEQAKRMSLDPAFHEQPTPQEGYLTDKIDQANDKLRAMATGRRTTYSKGVGDEEGQFFKTTNGIKEEITENRYNLENLERTANEKGNSKGESNAASAENEKPIHGEENAISEKVGQENVVNPVVAEVAPITKEGENHATKQIGEQEVGGGEHQDGNGSGETTETSGSNSSVSTEKGAVTQAEVPKQNEEQARRQKAIDAVTHGIVVPEKIFGRDPSARFDFGMTTAEKQKAVRDIKAGNYETVPAKKMLDKLQEWDKNDEYPIIEGLGGSSQRTRYATAKDIQENIDDAKAHKIGELSQRQIDEINAPLKELGFTHQDFIDYENHRAEQERNNGSATESTSKPIQQSENDKGASSPQNTSRRASQSEPSVSSIRNEAIDADRKARGQSPLMSEARKSFGKTWDDAMERIDKDPKAGEKLVNELAGRPRPLTDAEHALLLHRQIELKNEYDELNYEIVSKAEKSENVDDLHGHLSDVSDQLQRLEDVARKTGTESGRGLNARKLMAKDDFSLATLEMQKRAANNGRPLTAEEREHIREVHKEFEAKQAEYEKRISELEQRNRDLQEKQVLDKLKREAKQQSRTQSRQVRLTNREQIIQDIRNKLREARKDTSAVVIPYAKELAAIAPELAKLAKYYIADGIDTLDELVDKIHDDLKEGFEGLTKRAVRDAISGYGREVQKETKPELQKKLEALKSEAKLVSKLEDLERKEYKAKPRGKPAISEQIAELRKKIKELQQPDISLKYAKTRIANQIKEYQRRLKERDFSTQPPRQPTLLDEEAIKAKGELNRIRQDYNAELEKDRLANRDKWQKGWDTFLKYRRAELLLNLTGAAKVGLASAYRIITTPLHEITGTVEKAVIPGLKKIADKAPREGHGFVKDAEWKAFKTIWNADTLAEVKKKLKGKLDNLDLTFGDKQEHFDVNTLLDLAGNIHSAEKEFAKQNEFRRSVILRTKWAQEHGIDTDSPITQMQIGVEALKDANRQIFMGDNLLNEKYSEFLNGLERRIKNPKDKSTFWPKILHGAARVLLPIVRVPTNYAIEKFQYTPILGAVHAATIMAKGLEKMQPHEADYVMRVMKKQGIGAGLVAIGYFNPKVFGGFYVPGGKRDNKDLKANDINIFGIHVPHWATHTPMLSLFQLGATIRRAVDSSKTPGSDVGMATTNDLAESTPFYETPKQLVNAMESSKNMAQFAGNFARGLLIPSAVSQYAAYKDKDANGEPIQRHPSTFLEGVEEGIPGLRKDVPIKVPRTGFDKITVGDNAYKLNNDQIQEREKYYDEFMASETAKNLQETIDGAKTEAEKKRLTTTLHRIASEYSKSKIMGKYYNPETGEYDLEKSDE